MSSATERLLSDVGFQRIVGREHDTSHLALTSYFFIHHLRFSSFLDCPLPQSTMLLRAHSFVLACLCPCVCACVCLYKFARRQCAHAHEHVLHVCEGEIYRWLARCAAIRSLDFGVAPPGADSGTSHRSSTWCRRVQKLNMSGDCKLICQLRLIH